MLTATLLTLAATSTLERAYWPQMRQYCINKVVQADFVLVYTSETPFPVAKLEDFFAHECELIWCNMGANANFSQTDETIIYN